MRSFGLEGERSRICGRDISALRWHHGPEHVANSTPLVVTACYSVYEVPPVDGHVKSRYSAARIGNTTILEAGQSIEGSLCSIPSLALWVRLRRYSTRIPVGPQVPVTSDLSDAPAAPSPSRRCLLCAHSPESTNLDTRGTRFSWFSPTAGPQGTWQETASEPAHAVCPALAVVHLIGRFSGHLE